MPTRLFDVLALGNAIVDIVGSVEEDTLVRQRFSKGSMSLIDEARAEALSSSLPHAVRISGGSAANTAAGLASLGGRAAFVGKVKNDEIGKDFQRYIRAAGVHFPSAPTTAGPATARCIVLVTPDGERTMGTYLGASQNLTPEDVDETLVAQSGIVYLEGYLWDPPHAKEAFRRAARAAHATGAQVAFSLSDPFCVDRYREEFMELIRSSEIDILFANQHELKSLFQTAELETALDALRATRLLSAVTRSEDGCSILTGETRIDVPARPVERVIDATGAGDLFAAGFLHGLAKGSDLETCGRLGALAASEAISHFGARPERRLAELAFEAGLTA